MRVEHLQEDGHIFYRIWSVYTDDTLACEPGELLALLRWLQEHEDEINQDASNHGMNP